MPKNATAKKVTASTPTRSTARRGASSYRTNPFPVMTIKGPLPAGLGRERTDYGWEELVRVKQFKRIPADLIVKARASIQGFQAKHKDDKDGPFVGVKLATQAALDDDGKIIPQMEGDHPVKDERGNIVPAFYDVIRVR
jgi:hypothetical protein